MDKHTKKQIDRQLPDTQLKARQELQNRTKKNKI